MFEKVRCIISPGFFFFLSKWDTEVPEEITRDGESNKVASHAVPF